MRRIYFDNAATTRVDPRVLAAMRPYFQDKFGNPSSLYQLGIEAREAVGEARGKVAKLLNCSAQEVIFTSGATEAINLAHKGLFEVTRGKHLLTTAIEHKAVIETAKHLEKGGTALTFLGVDKEGLVDVDGLKRAIRKETGLVSVMLVNNEVGTIEPIEAIGRLLRKINEEREKQSLSRIYFHCDATQGIQYLNCDVQRLGIDLLSLTGHKFHAPKGVGALYVRAGTPLVRQLDGGGQEDDWRAGTENVPYIVGLGKAVEIIGQEKGKAREVASLRGRLVSGVLRRIKAVSLTGHPEKRAPHIASFIVKGVEGEAMILALDDQGMAVSSGSACTSGELRPSHVLLAMGFKPAEAHGSLRVSLSKNNTKEEVDCFLEVFPGIVEKLRKMSPLS